MEYQMLLQWDEGYWSSYEYARSVPGRSVSWGKDKIPQPDIIELDYDCIYGDIMDFGEYDACVQQHVSGTPFVSDAVLRREVFGTFDAAKAWLAESLSEYGIKLI